MTKPSATRIYNYTLRAKPLSIKNEYPHSWAKTIANRWILDRGKVIEGGLKRGSPYELLEPIPISRSANRPKKQLQDLTDRLCFSGARLPENGHLGLGYRGKNRLEWDERIYELYGISPRRL